MVRMIPLVILVSSLVALACLVQPTPEPEPSPTAVGTPRPEGSPTSAPPATPTPQVVTEGGKTFNQYGAPPLMTIDPSGSYTATINTNRGAITVELYAQDAPKTVNNFTFLAGEGFYDGVIFHRVIPDFMIQGGDPTGTGTAGPGYRFEDEISPDRAFDSAGILAMANAGPGTNGSQFFITVAPTPHLTGDHTIFGKVTSGQDVVDDISLVPTSTGNRPVADVIINTIDVDRDGG